MSAPSNNITGRAAFLSVMKDEGVTRMFGNPGTTELPIMHALTDEPAPLAVAASRCLARLVVQLESFSAAIRAAAPR